MAINLKQNLRLTQSLLLTPQLQQAIKLLQLSRVELCEFINEQLVENPVLEEKTTSSEVNKDNDGKAAVGERDNFDTYASKKREREKIKDATSFLSQKKDQNYLNYENTVSNQLGLSEHLLKQLGLFNLSKEEKDLATLIVGNINEKGYLSISLEEICAKEKKNLTVAKKVLTLIQSLDPAGVGARSLDECLLLQLKEHEQDTEVIRSILSLHLQNLVVRDYNSIAKDLNLTLTDLLPHIAVIAGLEPNPGRQFFVKATEYIVPDLYIYKLEDKWIISLNLEGIPNIGLSKQYLQMNEKLTEKKEKEYLSEQVKSASWLIKSLEQRQKTIYRVMECILKKQKKFFDKGVSALQPMILKDIADELGLHESTVSRVTNNKYVHTPRGLIELKFFFSGSFVTKGGRSLANQSIKFIIKEMVEKEDDKSPLSDQDMVKILGKKGVKIARRTVAKYREQMGIVASSKRKKFY
jgi:RNA polymerase sigma-54 factor